MAEEHKDKFCSEIQDMLNTGNCSPYIKHAKYVLLRKKVGAFCHVEDTRCIQLLNNTNKIME